MSFDDPTSIRPFSGAEDDRPTWAVVSIADLDGSGADGAFTDGLAEYGLPELALWARPSQGDDPGADWLLTHDDRLALLDGWGLELLAGSLSPDAVQHRLFDHGHATVTFRFSAPVPAADAGIHDLPPGRQVIVVGWSLNRRTPAAAPDPSSASVRRVERWRSRAQVITANWRREQRTPAAAQLTADRATVGRATSGEASRFGPMSAWVTARMEQLLAAGQPVLAEFFHRIPYAELVRCEHCLQEELAELASRHGRGGPAREAINAGQFLVPALTGEPPYRECEAGREIPPCSGPPANAWRLLVDRISGAFPALAADDLQDLMRERLRKNIESLLLAAVVADVADTRLMASACGCWEWAVHGGRVPGRGWLASVAARATTSSLLTGPKGESLLIPVIHDGAAQSWEDAILEAEWSLGFDSALGPVLDPELRPGAERATSLITGLQTAASASARPGWLLSARQRAGLTRGQIRQAESLAAPLLAAIAQPISLHPDTWSMITAPLRPYIPDLPERAL